MNPISERLIRGTYGELLVQLRLLQYRVQAAQPLKDSGNDLIAVKGSVFKAIQVKTTASDRFRFDSLPSLYHLVALVALIGEGDEIDLEASQVFLMPREEVERMPTRSVRSLADWRLGPGLVERLFVP